MSDAKFDTMAAVQALRGAGVAPRQAEAVVTAISESQRNLATKDDLTTEITLLRKDMDAGFKLIETKLEDQNKLLQANMDARFESVHAENRQLRTEMQTLEANVQKAILASQRTILLWLGAAAVGVVTAFGLIITLVQLLT